MNWQEILLRALISGAAGAASTGALVMSAENAPKLRKDKKKRRKRRRRRRRPGDPPPRKRKPTRAQKRARDKRRKEAEAAVADPGRLAIKHLAETSEPGLSTSEFLQNLKGSGRSMKDGVGRLFGLGPPKEEAPVEPEEDTRDRRRGRHGQRPDPRSSRSRRRRPKQSRDDGLEALKQDVMFLAKDKVKQKVVEATGMGEGVGKIKDVAEGIGDRASDVAGVIGDVAKDGAEKITETAGAVAKNAGELASSVRDNLPEDGIEAIGDGAKGLGRWLQGPGAQNYDGGRSPRELTGGSGHIVEAKMLDAADADTREQGRAAEQASVTPRFGGAASTASSPADGDAAPAAEDAGPFRAAQEVAHHDVDDDKRWATVEPGAQGASLPRHAGSDEDPAPSDEDAAPSDEGAEQETPDAWQADESRARAPSAGETVDAELLPSPSEDVSPENMPADEAASEDVVQARIDDDAPPPLRRHRNS